MPPQTTVNTWLKDLSTGLALDESGVCSFAYGEDLECALECPAQSDLLYLYAPLAPLPPDDDATARADFYEHVLKLNLFGRETAGGMLAADEQERAILFCYTHPIRSLDQVSFGNLLASFVETAARLKPMLRMTPDESQPFAPGQTPAFDPAAQWSMRA